MESWKDVFKSAKYDQREIKRREKEHKELRSEKEREYFALTQKYTK